MCRGDGAQEDLVRNTNEFRDAPNEFGDSPELGSPELGQTKEFGDSPKEFGDTPELGRPELGRPNEFRDTPELGQSDRTRNLSLRVLILGCVKRVEAQGLE